MLICLEGERERGSEAGGQRERESAPDWGAVMSDIHLDFNELSM